MSVTEHLRRCLFLKLANHGDRRIHGITARICAQDADFNAPCARIAEQSAPDLAARQVRKHARTGPRRLQDVGPLRPGELLMCEFQNHQPAHSSRLRPNSAQHYRYHLIASYLSLPARQGDFSWHPPSKAGPAGGLRVSAGQPRRPGVGHRSVPREGRQAQRHRLGPQQLRRPRIHRPPRRAGRARQHRNGEDRRGPAGAIRAGVARGACGRVAWASTLARGQSRRSPHGQEYLPMSRRLKPAAP